MPSLADDDEHPIPKVGVIDTVVDTDKGAYFGLVIASPFRCDEGSLARLRCKINNYFEHFESVRATWLQTHEEPIKLRFEIAVHHASDSGILLLLHDAERRASQSDISLKLSSIDDDYNIHD